MFHSIWVCLLVLARTVMDCHSTDTSAATLRPTVVRKGGVGFLGDLPLKDGMKGKCVILPVLETTTLHHTALVDVCSALWTRTCSVPH